jgi:autotransporter translocation and assembly factor TamB
MRTLFKSGVWILFILLSLLIVLALFVSTDSGTKILAQVAQGLSSDIKIKGVQGSVIRELKVEELHWQNNEQKIHIKQLQLKNNLSTLLSKRLDLESLSMDYIQVDLGKT